MNREVMNRVTITISDEQTLMRIDHSLIEQTAHAVLMAEQVAAAEIDIALVDDAKIHAINRKYLNHDEPTDVISFALGGTQWNAVATVGDPAEHLEGQLVISVETAIRAAGEYGWEPIDELRLYVVHGLLHLCGYDDLTTTDQTAMRERERAILQSCGLMPHDGDGASGADSPC